MRSYMAPTVELIEFEKETFMLSSKTCNCEAQQYDNKASLLDGCELTSYGFIEIADHY